MRRIWLAAAYGTCLALIALVALHGSWNRHQRADYSVIRIPFKNGMPVGGYE